MASYEGRRSFLLGMTLNELAFMMFFLLMLLSTAALHHKAVQLERETEKNNALEQTLKQTRSDLDTTFKRLQLIETALGRLTGTGSQPTLAELDETFAKLQTVEHSDRIARENERLKAQLQQIQPLQKQLNQIDPTATPTQTLTTLLAEHRNLRGQLHFLQRQLKGNGLDHPPCWADPETGSVEYLYRITIYEHQLSIAADWPKSRAGAIRSIPGAAALADQTVDLETFEDQAQPVYRWSQMHECRHFVRIHDDPSTSKRAFKTALLTIESVFYKYLEH